jgi:DNA-binding transcriptional LysR family regulator
MNNLRRLDLNLLVTLDVLLSEHNVTRAAQRLNFSQPSVSVQLAKLRDIFGDPLLLPGPRGMRPTARAEALREPLREALESLERAVLPETPFEPAKAAHTWRVAATDYGESTIVLPALGTLRAAAPARGSRSSSWCRRASRSRPSKATSISRFIRPKVRRTACGGARSSPSATCSSAAPVIRG